MLTSSRVPRRWPGPLALVVVAAAASPAARAQVGSGWVQYDPPSTIQLDGANGIETYPGDSTNVSNAGAAYTNMGGIETFILTSNISNRAERRLRNDYTSGRRQFEGEVRVSPPTNDESVTQVFGGTSGATTQMIRAYDVDGGTLRKVPGSVVLAAGIYGTWVKINVVHDIPANNVKTYVNGKLIATGDGEAPATWYTKYGCYGTLRTPSAKVEWRSVKHFRDGTNPPGDQDGGASGNGGAAGSSDGPVTDGAATMDAPGTSDSATSEVDAPGGSGGQSGTGGQSAGTGGRTASGGQSGAGGGTSTGRGGSAGVPVIPDDPQARGIGCGCRLADVDKTTGAQPPTWATTALLGLLAAGLVTRRRRR